MPEIDPTQAAPSPADVNQDSSPVEQPSAETSQSGEATPQQATETPFHQHPRWQEREAELRRERERADRLERELLSRSAVVQRDDSDPLNEADPETKKWVSTFLDPIVNKRIEKALSVKEKSYQEELGSLRSAYGQLAASEFLKSHPDVKRGSEEMNQIINKAKSSNVDLDDAYKVVMFDKVREKTVQEERTKQQNQIKMKAAANVETKSIPAASPASNEKKSFEDIFAEQEKALNITKYG